MNSTPLTSCACLSSDPAPAANDDAVDTNDAVDPCTIDKCLMSDINNSYLVDS